MSELTKLWICDDRGELATVELNTNTVTVIGSMGIIMLDIAWSPSGELWGVDDSSRLYKIDPNNAQARMIGNLGGFVNALTFNQDGTLYAAGGNSLYTVNTITGAVTLMGNLPVSSGGDLTFVNNELYLSTTNSELYKVNISDPPSSRICSFGVANIYGIAATSANNAIYGVGDGHRVVKVDLATGVGTLAFACGGRLGEAYGMAFRKESIVGPNAEIEIPLKLKGQFEVPAISPEGVAFTNPTDKEVLIEFSPSGEGSFKPGKQTTAAGILHPEEPLLGELKYPNLPAYALSGFR